MRYHAIRICLAALLAGACSGTEAARTGESEVAPATEQDPAQALALAVEEAIRANDPGALDALVRFDGVDEPVLASYERLTRGGILGRPINGVSLSPPDPSLDAYEHDGVAYALNGTQVGRVTIDFTMDNPSESETFSFVYGIEDGKGVILLAAPNPQ